MEITKLQDDDCHWYWIPNNMVGEFLELLDKIAGLDYMDAPDDFDRFSDRFEIYRTLGCSSNIPEIFNTHTPHNP